LSDIFREVEEDVRRERLEKFWKRHGVAVMVAVGLLLAGVAGWQYWRHVQAQERVAQADAFAAAQRISDPMNAAKAFGDIAKNAKGGYALVAKMAQAASFYASGQLKPAVDLYKEIGNADDGDLGHAARLRGAWIIAATATRQELDALLAPLNKDDSAWQPLAREILAFSDYRAAKNRQATEGYRALSEDAKAPQSLRERARAMVSFLENGAGGDFGTVPAIAAPPAPALPVAPVTPPPAAAQ
jgi:hypothetical protein